MQQFIQNPLQVITDPSGIQYVMPGDTVELHVIITNQGEQSAVIDLLLDEGLQSLTRSNISHRESLALDPTQSHEVTFKYEIPIDALAGTYDYTLVVDSPIHYPQYTPINFPRQIKVLLKEQTVIRQNDPTFSVLPATNPNKPLVFKQGEPLPVEVIVENRSNRVDRFRLVCPDLDEEWFSIIYPKTGSEAQGLLDVTALELLPGDRGQIKLVFHPTNTFAGNYSPTIRLHSENSPDLVLLELVYILVPTIYHLDVQLNTILGKVSRSSGKYEVKLTNLGNTVREVALKAKSIDEDELCKYKYDAVELRLLPSKKTEVNLTVTPLYWWRRSLFGSGQLLNFQVKVKDKQDLPLTETLPQGSLLWKARPWWQFVLLILLILGFLGGVGFIIWRLLNPEPLKLENFRATAPTIVEGDKTEVLLNWDIRNYKQLQKLSVIQQEPPLSKPLRTYDLSELIDNSKEEKSPKCQPERRNELLICTNMVTGVTIKNQYRFELKADYRKNIPLIPQKIQVATIAPISVKIDSRPIAEVLSFKTNKSEYSNGEKILFEWQINLPTELKRIDIISKGEDGIPLDKGRISFDFKKGSTPETIEKLCPRDSSNKILTCKNIPAPIPTPGNLTYELKAVSEGNAIHSLPNPIKIKVLPKPLSIVYFKINNSDQTARDFKEGEPIILEWKVEGDTGTNVNISNIGTVALQGKRPLKAKVGLQSPFVLTVNDSFGSPPKTRELPFTVIKPPPPTPTSTLNNDQFPILDNNRPLIPNRLKKP
jgi:hypothetical protein